ncbi:MAG: septum site-determining protein MinC [Lachnospiraceae bacterium]|nr:septum site-determining protein MinC [Lachnospiraceae bacterium]
MSDLVILKSNRYGINLLLDANASFLSIQEAVIEKFQESEKFFKNAKVGISFEGRTLSHEEERSLIEAIHEHSSVEILCIIDQDFKSEESTRQRVESTLATLSQVQPAEGQVDYGDYYKGTLRSGQSIVSEGNLIIVGDVNPGAHVSAAGNIIILGALKGNVQAGNTGDDSCFVFALQMNPIQIQIGTYIAKSPDREKGKRRIRRSGKDNLIEVQIAFVKNDAIYIEPVSKSILKNI